MNKEIFEEKDILELLNCINIDKDEEENLDLNMDDLRKKRLKKNLLKQVKGKRAKKNFKHKVVAASLIIAAALISVNIPAFAKNISEFKSVIQALIGYGVPKEGEYEKYSNSINKSVTDKGITLTINEVVCDDTELMIAYTIKTKDDIKKIVKERKDSSSMPFSLFPYIKINGKQAGSSSGSDEKYLDGHTYINSESMDIENMNLKNSFNVDLNVKNIYGVIGNWNLKFSVSKDEISKHTKVFKPNIKVKFPDALVNSSRIPKYLTVIPYRDIFSKDNSPIQETYKNIDGVYPIELSQGKMGKIIIKEIKTYKDKTVVKYKAEGKAPFLQAKQLFIKDDKDNVAQGKDNNFDVKKDSSPNEYIMEFEPLDKNKKYKIGTNDLSNYEIRNDLKFRIDLNK